jgi:hypothetical protein
LLKGSWGGEKMRQLQENDSDGSIKYVNNTTKEQEKMKIIHILLKPPK